MGDSKYSKLLTVILVIVVVGVLVLLGFLGFDVQGLTVVPDNNIPGAIKDKENQLAQVKAVGEKIVE